MGVEAHLFVDLGATGRLVTVVASSLSRERCRLVLGLLLILLGLGSSGELMTEVIRKVSFTVSVSITSHSMPRCACVAGESNVERIVRSNGN